MNAPVAGRYAPHLVLVLLIAIWGSSFAVVKVALDSLSPFALVAVRFWLAFACMLTMLRGRVVRDLRPSMRAGLTAGAALAIGYLLQMAGMRETSASMGGFLAGLIVLLVTIGGCVFFGARLGPRSLAGLGLGLLGMVFLCWPSDAGDGPKDTMRGIALQIGSSTSYAAHILILWHYGRSTPAVAFCLWQFATVAVAGSAAALVHGEFGAGGARVEWTPALLGCMAYLGVLASAIAIALQGRVQHRIAPTHLGLLYALQPLFAALVGWAALDDRMGALQLLGGMTIVAGVVVTSLERKQ
ncbi:MAG TPA: DMT family transporter [Planctomycetota bacterium]